MRSLHHNEPIRAHNSCNEEANRIKWTERTGLTWADEKLKNDEWHDEQ